MHVPRSRCPMDHPTHQVKANEVSGDGVVVCAICVYKNPLTKHVRHDATLHHCDLCDWSCCDRCFYEMRCDGSHVLTKFSTYNPTFMCDLCHAKDIRINFPVRSPMYGCRTCNWDTCTKCYGEKRLSCPQNHILYEANVSEETTCNICEEHGFNSTYKQGTLMASCLVCNWHACTMCYNEKRCPGRHTLKSFRTPTAGYECDSCCSRGQNYLDSDTLVHGCRDCDWYICDTCTNAYYAVKYADLEAQVIASIKTITRELPEEQRTCEGVWNLLTEKEKCLLKRLSNESPFENFAIRSRDITVRNNLVVILEDELKNVGSELEFHKRMDNTCIICFENEINSVIIPCGHFIICLDCSEVLPNNSCPVCREKIAQVVKVFR